MLATRQGGILTKKGWFIIPDIQTGDRTVDEQAIGLEGFDFAGKTVLDLGCAEGLISAYALMEGATLVHGCEIINDHLRVARRLMAGKNAKFFEMDLNNFKQSHKNNVSQMLPRYDVVLMLAIAHKLKDPATFIKYAATLADSLIIRLPARILSDKRSGFKPIDVPALLAPSFELVAEPTGPRGEWMGIFERLGHASNR